MIPKVIHWCWLSGDPLPEKIAMCVDSWKKVMPDYQVKCWTTKEFDVNSVPYVKSAYEAKRWAFCADYIRAYALYHEGGIYLDSDIQVLKRFDSWLAPQCMMCIEKHELKPGETLDMEAIARKYKKANCEIPDGVKFDPCVGIQAAALFSEKGHPFFKDILNYYERLSFAPSSQDKNEVLIAPSIYARVALDYGFVYEDCRQLLTQGIEIQPSWLINNGENVTGSTVAIHLENHSWIVLSRWMRLRNFLARFSLLRELRNLVR